ETGLVVEDATEVIAIRKDLILQWQKSAAGVDEIDAGQAVFGGDLLCAQMLLHGDREIRPAFHGCVVRNDHDMHAVDTADAGDDASTGCAAVVHILGGERRELEKRCTRVEK